MGHCHCHCLVDEFTDTSTRRSRTRQIDTERLSLLNEVDDHDCNAEMTTNETHSFIEENIINHDVIELIHNKIPDTFIQLDKTLAIYYKNNNKQHHYMDADQKHSLFLQYVVHHNCAADDIEHQLGDTIKPRDCAYIDFDFEHFPTRSSTNDEEKATEIFHIIQHCYKYGNAPINYIDVQKETEVEEKQTSDDLLQDIIVKDTIEEYEKQIVNNEIESKTEFTETMMDSDTNTEALKIDAAYHTNGYKTHDVLSIKVEPFISLNISLDSEDNEDRNEMLEIHAKNEKNQTYVKKNGKRKSRKKRTLKRDNSWLKADNLEVKQHAKHASVMELQLNHFVSSAKILEADSDSMTPKVTRSKSRKMKSKHLKLSQLADGNATV